MIAFSLRARIQFWFSGLSAVLLIVLVAWVSLQGAALSRSALDRSLELRAESICALCEREDDQVICEVGAQAMEQLVGNDPARGFFVHSWPGLQVLAGGGHFSTSELAPRDATMQAPYSHLDCRVVEDRTVRVLEVLRQCEGGPHDDSFLVRVVVAEDLAPLEAQLHEHDRVLLFAGLGTLLLFVGAGWFLAHRIVDPLAALAAGAQRVQAGHPGSLLGNGSGDEIDQLTNTLNEAFARLQAAILQQTRFTADASHELRTPLAIMRTQVEVALQRPRDGEHYRQALVEVLHGVQRMTSLVESLLLLARADAGVVQPVHEHVELLALLQQVAEQHADDARARQQQVVVDGGAMVAVNGDSRLLGILLNNLLGNAIRYSERPGTIRMTATCGAAGPVLCVADEGIGIAAEHLPHLFERFVRADDDRSRRAGGSGLGLSIVQAIAACHGAICHIESQVGRGTAVEVRFGSSPGP